MPRRRPPRTAGPLARLGIAAGYETAVERASALGCSRSHLLHCERGAMLPGLDLMDTMAAVYGVHLKDIERAAKRASRNLTKRGVL